MARAYVSPSLSSPTNNKSENENILSKCKFRFRDGEKKELIDLYSVEDGNEARYLRSHLLPRREWKALVPEQAGMTSPRVLAVVRIEFGDEFYDECMMVIRSVPKLNDLCKVLHCTGRPDIQNRPAYSKDVDGGLQPIHKTSKNQEY